MKARNLKIRQILATTAERTLEIDLETAKGIVRSSVPIGASRGRYEVSYLPVEDAIRKFLLIRRHFTNEELMDMEDVDNLIRIVDKTDNLREIGGNLALAISSAFLKAFALENYQEPFEYIASMTKEKVEIPKPICNIVGGGKHAGRTDIQEIHLLPVHQKSFLDSVTKIASAYRMVGKKLKENDPTFAFTENIESAWTTNLNLEEILKIMTRVANEHLLKLGLDFAATQLWDGKQYYVYKYSNKILNRSDQISFVRELLRRYPIIYVEDPFNEDDFESFSVLNHELTGKLVCSDDLYATNLKRLKDGIDFKATNSVIVKPNQVGTIMDTIKFVKEAKKNNLSTVMSHRSGETEDTLICHLAVGLGCNYIKIGIGGERATKVNEMIRIEEKIHPPSLL